MVAAKERIAVVKYKLSKLEMVSSLDDDEKDGVTISDTMGRDQTNTIISEPGLYKLVMKKLN